MLLIPQPEDKIVFLDIGQGDSILLQDGTSQVLIDGGPGMTVLTRLSEELPWFDKTIDVVISTHPDQDHLEGLLHVLERYKVKLVILPQIPHTSQLQAEWLKKLQDAIERNNSAYRFAWKGENLKFQDLNIEVLAPDQETLTEARDDKKTNDAAVIIRVDMHDRSLLLTADAESQVEKHVVETIPAEKLDVDILKAGHHGSKTSTTQQLLDAVSPSFVAISVGAKNRYGHPHPTVLDRLKTISYMRTDHSGSIRWIFKNNQWLLSCSKTCMKEGNQ